MVPGESFLDIQGHERQKKGAFFLNVKHKPVTRTSIASVLHQCLAMITTEPKSYNTHSFRIGKITDLATSGSTLLQVRNVGRFHSTAFQAYIKPTIVSIT